MSLTHWLVVALLVILLFGRGKISDLMGDVAKGIKSFKKGMAEDEDAKTDVAVAPVPPAQPTRTIEHQPVAGEPTPTNVKRAEVNS
ncbi:twin-arginine translocase TatA/TatE family subunit [Terrihabitans sp. B22-R8]|uniref:twin-arginine translocase TatA/TatE family subunit n=1 Tax=Terrihabitans sp. B22-R8 TaxID=3425128 RepID=UPI00403C543C